MAKAGTHAISKKSSATPANRNTLDAVIWRTRSKQEYLAALLCSPTGEFYANVTYLSSANLGSRDSSFAAGVLSCSKLRG